MGSWGRGQSGWRKVTSDERRLEGVTCTATRWALSKESWGTGGRSVEGWLQAALVAKLRCLDGTMGDGTPGNG